MRSKLGTKSRLAAHIVALVLLILMLVYLPPSPGGDGERSRRTGPEAVLAGARRPATVRAEPPIQTTIQAPARAPIQVREETPLAKHAPPGRADTLDRVHTPSTATRFPEAGLRPPGSEGVVAEAAPAPGITAKSPSHAATLTEASASVPSDQPIRPPAVSEESKEPEESEESEEPADQIHEETQPEPAAETPPETTTETTTETAPETTEDPVPAAHDAVRDDAVHDAVHDNDDETAAAATPDADAQVEELAPFAREESPSEETGDKAASEPVNEASEEKPDSEEPVQTEQSPEPAPESIESINESVPELIPESTNETGEETPQKPEEESPAPPPETLPMAQPDESGSLVVAASDAGLSQPQAATTPLPNAALEVLGDGVYWLDSSHELEKELATVPDIGSLVLLTPLPDYHVHGFEHVKTEAIPADVADLTADSAERFLHETSELKRPVVVAPLSGARGAAFFKGAYLLANRNLTVSEVLREIEPELEQSGEARDEIVHRLLRMPRPDRERTEQQSEQRPEESGEETENESSEDSALKNRAIADESNNASP